MKGAISSKDEQYHTYLKKLFIAIDNRQLQYNWLITDHECYPKNNEFANLLSAEYVWITGEELTKMIQKEDFQWIWAVLSGFKKDIQLEDILKYELPYAKENYDFWKSPVRIHHPLAEIEIIADDSTSTIVISQDDEIVNSFIRFFPLSEDYERYTV